MRIAIFSNKFPLLSETFVINQIVGLIELGAHVDIITTETLSDNIMHESVRKYALLDKVVLKKSPMPTGKLRKVLAMLNRIVKLILRGRFIDLLQITFDSHLDKWQKFDLINRISVNQGKPLKYSNVICHFGQYGYYVCKLRQLGLIAGPISTIFHGQEVSRYKMVEEYKPVYKKLFLEGDLMLPISDLWKGRLISWGANPTKVTVHRMGVDVNDFQMRALEQPLSNPIKVIQVGRLTEKKAILDSINAVVICAKKIDVQFTIIGEGELYEDAKQLINSFNASHYIHLLGKQPQEVVKQKLDSADIFLLPSVTANDGDMEGIPVALMEAMAKGLITLSTYHSGIPELIENEISGFLVEEGNVEDIAKSIIKINQLPLGKLQSIRLSARKVCEDRFNNLMLNKNLLSIHETIS